jgi:hypothetical protein
MVRCANAHEHAPVQRARRSPITQIPHERLADIRRQRQPLAARTLAAYDQFTRAPVDVLQRQRRVLRGSQRQPRQHRQDRHIPDADDGRRVARGQQRVDLAGLKALGQPRQPRPVDRWHRVGQRTLERAFQMQEAKQRPQRHDRQLCRPEPQPRTRLDHEPAHLGHVHAPELQPVRALEPHHDRADLLDIAAGGRRHQATLLERPASRDSLRLRGVSLPPVWHTYCVSSGLISRRRQLTWSCGRPRIFPPSVGRGRAARHEPEGDGYAAQNDVLGFELQGRSRNPRPPVDDAGAAPVASTAATRPRAAPGNQRTRTRVEAHHRQRSQLVR